MFNHPEKLYIKINGLDLEYVHFYVEQSRGYREVSRQIKLKAFLRRNKLIRSELRNIPNINERYERLTEPLPKYLLENIKTKKFQVSE